MKDFFKKFCRLDPMGDLYPRLFCIGAFAMLPITALSVYMKWTVVYDDPTLLYISGIISGIIDIWCIYRTFKDINSIKIED